MNEKAKLLLKAINEMNKLSDFEKNVHDLLRFDVFELQPSLCAGILFDILVKVLLTEEGADLTNEFLFSIVKYDEDNPFEITETIDGLETVYKIRTPEALCLYLEKNNCFK